MFDTNIFSECSDDFASMKLRDGVQIYSTTVQLDELRNTKDPNLRTKLEQRFQAMSPIIVDAESFVWGVTQWGSSKWNKSEGLFDQLKKELATIDAKKKHKDPLNPARDVVMAETAVYQNYVFVSEDSGLREAINNCDGCAVSWAEFTSSAAL